MQISKLWPRVGVSVVAAFAIALAGIGPAAAANRGSDFCNQLGKISVDISTKLNQNIGGPAQHPLDVASQIKTRRNDFDKKLKAARDSWNQQRQNQYASLLTKAKTDEQKAAIEQYKNTIEAATLARRSSVDAAIVGYRGAVDMDIASDRGNIEGIGQDFASDVRQAISTAKNSCAQGAEPSQVRAGFAASLQAAHQKLDVARDGTDQVKVGLQTLDQTKRAAIEQAIGQFRQTAESAAQTLRSSFGEDGAKQSSFVSNIINSL